jgi:hypothetical protein
MDNKRGCCVPHHGDHLKEIARAVWSEIEDLVVVEFGHEQCIGDSVLDVLIGHSVLPGRVP